VEIIIFKKFLEHQEIANASPYQEDPYLLPWEDVKSIACSVQKLWCCKLGVPNCDAAAVRSSSSSRTLVVKGFDEEKETRL
jgi:hypothetical protein